jgi:hypothetical protein
MTAHFATRPDFIGCYDVAGERRFYGATGAEVDRASFTISRVLRTFEFEPGSNILTISMVPEIIQYGAFERAVQMLGLYGLNADDSPFDAGRVESVARQFTPVAICGVAKSTLDGLAMMGHDPAIVFAGRVVWARPDAYDAVRALGIPARRVASIGPMLALECASGGLHFDNRDWTLEDRDGELSLSSRMDRVEALERLQTGYIGQVSHEPCACGTRDAVVRLS